MTETLLLAGASLSAVDKKVIEPSVKLRQLNIEPSSDAWGMSSKIKKIDYHTLCAMCCFNRVIELSQKMLLLKRFVTKKKKIFMSERTKLMLNVI